MPADGVERVMEALSRPHHQRGYFFRFPLAVIDGENKRIRANRPLEEGSVSCYRLLLDKLQGKIDSAAVEYVFSREIWQSAGGFVHFPMAWCSGCYVGCFCPSCGGCYFFAGAACMLEEC